MKKKASSYSFPTDQFEERQYDRVGNWTELKTEKGKTAYEYNERYAMTKAVGEKAGAYEYDANGNLAFDGEERFYYDATSFK